MYACIVAIECAVWRVNENEIGNHKETLLHMQTIPLVLRICLFVRNFYAVSSVIPCEMAEIANSGNHDGRFVWCPHFSDATAENEGGGIQH